MIFSDRGPFSKEYIVQILGITYGTLTYGTQSSLRTGHCEIIQKVNMNERCAAHHFLVVGAAVPTVDDGATVPRVLLLTQQSLSLSTA